MGASLRALRALVLLAGFYLLGLAVLTVLALIDWAATLWTPGPWALKFYVVTAVLAVPVVRGMLLLRTPTDEIPASVLVTDADEPRLWRAVRELAEQVGTRAPGEIRLTAEVNAAVSEDSRLLGLLGGRRRLYLGLPLMAGLSEARLRAVLAHEFGHFTHADTRLSALTARCRVQVERTVAHFEEKAGGKVAKERARQERKAAKRIARGRTAHEIDTTGVGFTLRTMARIYTAYGRFSLRATQADSRRQEIAADLAASRVAGRDATASALREIAVVEAANGFFLDSYATLGAEFGMLPPHGEVIGGVRHLLAARSEELEDLRQDLPTQPASPYDSHPPMAERVARLEALADDGRGAPASPPSLSLLVSPDRSLAAVEDVSLTADALLMRRVEWADLVHEAMSARSMSEAEPLLHATAEVTGTVSRGAVLDALLDAVDAGKAWEIADRLPKSERAGAATGRAAREFARPVLRRGLSLLVTDALTEDGRARWQLSWAAPAVLLLPPGYEDELPAALDAAVADRPDTGPLRMLLHTP
ncbi:M48 family metalloprotease [Streptomyces sp. ISL-36]|uniref:M48 family metalloprotease n=1 Tax=Streptomyces sp. ISL-36 TaxID=2819182 RepID=UPI001BE5DAF6|nr:M48 family metallopeptidase [Streptomyces sp. ISL-36]MBT2444160.1 M48 family metalloprotease [Streptomyces sp. ISL-36]